MNDELTLKLFNEFPELFKYRKDYRQSLMGFGFACDDGWFNLIYKLCKDIKAILDKTPIEGFYVVQIKEKLGGLRFYITHATKEIFNLIEEAEKKSYHTCEVCGKEGKLRIKIDIHWYKTLCKDCSTELGYIDVEWR